MLLANFTIETILWALLGGVLPTFIWLWFWLRNDVHPEPKGMLVIAFIVGAILVPLVIPIQQWLFTTFELTDLWSVFMVSSIEEILKFVAIGLVAFGTPVLDEPIDYAVYLITGALGFAALENTLFLLTPLSVGDTATALTTGNLRFVGATLLHVLASGIVGISMGLAFNLHRGGRLLFTIVGLGNAIAFHALFNAYITTTTDSNEIALILAILWITATVLFFMERLIRKLHWLEPVPRPRFY